MNSFRGWLLKILFGKRIEQILDLDSEVRSLQLEVAKSKRDMRQLITILQEITNKLPADGWTEVIETAVIQLDKRIDVLREIITHHEEAIEAIIEEAPGFVIEDKDNLN